MQNIDIQTLTYKGKIVFERVKADTFERLPKQYNENESCFIFVESGNFLVRTPEKLLVFEKNNGFLAKCINYLIENNQDKKEPIDLIGVLLYPDIIKELFTFEISEQINNRYDAHKIKIDSLLMNFKESIKLLIETPELADEVLIKNKLKEFILLISKTVHSISELDFLTQIFSPSAYNFKSVIDAHLTSDLSLDELAHLCSMSLSSFHRKFNEVYAESPKTYINKKKIEKASKLLKITNNRITSIAFDCGFESISTFNRIFHKEFGMSPTQYRNTRKR